MLATRHEPFTSSHVCGHAHRCETIAHVHTAGQHGNSSPQSLPPFCRAKLRYNMHRLKPADASNPTCRKCNMDADETTVHTLLECSAYTRERDVCEQALRGVSSVFFSDDELSTYPILSPELFTNQEKLLSQALSVTHFHPPNQHLPPTP